MMGGLGFGSGEGAAGERLEWVRYAPVWKAGLEVLAEPWRGDAPARAMLVVIADRNVLHDEVIPAARVRAPADAAGALERALDSVAAEAKCHPQTLLVHDAAVAAHLAPRLERYGTTVRVPPTLREVRNTIRMLARLVDEPDLAWDLCPLEDDDETLDPAFAAVLFPAAARFWRARPWEGVRDEKPLRFRWHGRKSVAVLTHPRGHGYAVTLYTSARDYCEPRALSPRRSVLGIRFGPASALPRPLRRQIAAAGWEVAAPDAYRSLWATARPWTAVPPSPTSCT